jgi:hypothetical protein
MKRDKSKEIWRKVKGSTGDPISLKDTRRIIEAKETGDWETAHQTRTYIKYGRSYCRILEEIEEMGIETREA